MTTCCPAGMPNGASVQAVTVLAVGAGQPGAVPGEGIGPSTRAVTVTIRAAVSKGKPTAPFQLNGAAPAGKAVPGEKPVVAPSVVAGSPRTNVPLNGVLN